MQERIQPQNVWERELLEAYTEQMDRAMDTGRRGDIEDFKEEYAHSQTIYKIARQFDVPLGTLAWNAGS